MGKADDLEGNIGFLTYDEQVLLFDEYKIYKAMALRLERALHDLIKEAEK